MTHSFRKHYFHLIWSTRGRKPFLTSDIVIRLYPYIGSIVKERSGHLIEIGGMPDHIHLLIEMSFLDNFSSVIRDIKASTSLWIHKNFAHMDDFAWQEGYGSFSVSYSVLDSVQKYVRNQEQHHASMTFDQEYAKLLKLHDITPDFRFVYG
jgi:REP element-mobilizing transposase RayT